ncbi:amidohydrolase family protein [Nakamurella endophytica]|uniref:5-methylthioadenosine/S-adenosylhomocysteine deaminase n=1 Tax=Nakamurella endophytica TaxID=1748367 RepID=A0A917T1N8_9ACTN|nr:amidohydrolase family protein [Nakamurella endophytica]GGM07157.1 5-methylthioadenosine/S-adenosylhomocysteine deaminase [Nakamurella endophytica]
MTERRIVGTTILCRPGEMVPGEIAWSPETGRITHLGPARGPAGPDDLDGSGRLVLPGLVNAHTHAGMGLLRGVSDDLPLATWLRRVRESEVRMTAGDVRAGLRLALAEMLRTGTVGFVDMFAWTPDLLGDVLAAGLRVNAAPAVFGYDGVAFPAAWDVTGAEVLDGVPALAAAVGGEPRVTVSYGLHAPYTCPPEMIRDVARRRAVDGVGVHIHLSETRREVEESVRRHGVSPVRLVADLGLLAGRTHVAHAVHLLDGDLELLAGEQVTVAHNPVSNLKLGAGVAPVPALLAAGVRLGLGTDSVASNNTLDLFEELKTGSLVQRGVAEDAAVTGVDGFLALATAGGAAALDQGLTGALAVGAPADLVLLDVTGTTATPLGSASSFVGYAATGADVTDVVVAGRTVVADRRCLTVDEEAARAEVVDRAAHLRRRVSAG